MKVKVVQITQSPMNAQRWYLSTSCGHDAWITSKSKPKRATIDCHACDQPQ